MLLPKVNTWPCFALDTSKSHDDEVALHCMRSAATAAGMCNEDQDQIRSLAGTISRNLRTCFSFKVPAKHIILSYCHAIGIDWKRTIALICVSTLSA